MEARQLLATLLDRVGCPVAVVDERLGLRYANAPARRLLRERAGLRITSGRLWAIPPQADERLRVVIRAAIAPGGAGGLVRLGADDASQVVRIEPLPPEQSGTDRPLALIVANPRRPVNASELRTAYDLTAREAAVAALFADGLGIRETAIRLGRSVNTVKTIARAVYFKLGVYGHAGAAVRIRTDLSA